MLEHNRVLSWKKIADIQRKQKVRHWNHKPKFRIGENNVVKKTAKSIYGDTGDSIWNGLVAGFDKCRKPLRGRQGVVVEVTHDKDYGCSYFVRFGNKSGDKKGRKVMMDEQWLRKRKRRETCEDFIGNMIYIQVIEDDGY